jgi:outer membrane protein assembly factor BamB
LLQTITIDQRDNRVFLLATNVLMTVNATTGALIYSQTLPEGEVSGIGVDERTSRLFISEYPEAYHDRKAGPATISVVDTRTGHVIRSLSTDSQKLFVGTLVVDGPDGVVLSSAGNSGTVLDARTGAIRRTVKLPTGGITSPAAVDPATGHIFGFSSGGISELDPKTWRQVRHIPGAPFTGRAIIPDDRAGRIFALEFQHGHDDVRAICTRAHCR